jgi:hypothetical protein
MVNKGVVMKENEKFRGWQWHPQCIEIPLAELAKTRAELRAKLETAMLMSKLMRMSKE